MHAFVLPFPQNSTPHRTISASSLIRTTRNQRSAWQASGGKKILIAKKVLFPSLRPILSPHPQVITCSLCSQRSVLRCRWSCSSPLVFMSALTLGWPQPWRSKIAQLGWVLLPAVLPSGQSAGKYSGLFYGGNLPLELVNNSNGFVKYQSYQTNSNLINQRKG